MNIFDDRACALGEGPLWHPERQSLFWFDILNHQLMSKDQVWQFDEHVSAAGWLDQDHLLIASETALFQFNLETEAKTHVAALEADMPITRSNDGRADPYGGFWIGTMGKSAEPRAGTIYRYYRGEVRKLFAGITVSNAICFSPDGLWAYFCDTFDRQIKRQALATADGWPQGDPEVYIDLKADELNPDGAVVDSQGRLWNAHWGAGRLACYEAGKHVQMIDLPASQTTCPAFGGADLKTLYCTSAAVGVDERDAGKTFSIDVDIPGQTEHRVIL
ncbi:MAG: SMP-30/gluconolactonase/LRE family protein [Paracoccaceae bacterium]